MLRRLFSSLRVRLSLLTFLAVMPMLALALYSYFQERSSVILHMRDDVRKTAEFTAGVHEQFIEATRQLLRILAQLPDVRTGSDCSNNSHFTETLGEYPMYANLGVIGADGSVFCNAALPHHEANVSSEPWFRNAMENRNFSMGVSRSGCVANVPTLNISYSIQNDSGGVEMIVFAAMDVEKLNELTFQSLARRGEEDFILVTKSGTILAYPADTEEWLGRTTPDSPLVRAILEIGEGVAELNGLDGVARLYAFTPLCKSVDTGLYVSVGITLKHAYAHADKHLMQHISGLALITILIIIAIWFGGDRLILKHLRALASAAEHLSKGDMKARIGPPYGRGELGHLAGVFDEMAEILDQQATQLREAEARYRTLVEQMPAITYIVDLHQSGRILYVSPQIETILGFSSKEWTSDPGIWMRQVHPDDIEYVLSRLSSLRSGKSAGFRAEYRMKSKDGHIVWLHDEALIISDSTGTFQYIQGIVRDITEYRRAEEKLLAYQLQLRSLASELSLAEERERRRIATELHDRVGQALAISKIKICVLKESAGKEFEPALDEVRKFIEEAILDTRALMFKISPPILYELGFEAALEWLAEETQKQHGITARYESDGSHKPMDDDIRVMMFQAANELLVNVAKHAQARHVMVSSRRIGEFIHVAVQDDGVGFDTSAIGFRPDSTGGFGIFSIRERLSYIGGRLEIASQPGCGTRITLVAPLKITVEEGREDF